MPALSAITKVPVCRTAGRPTTIQVLLRMPPKLIGALANKGCFMGRAAHVEPKQFANGKSLERDCSSFIMKSLKRLTDAALSDLPLVNAVFTGL
jgi:hypothetical protein